MAGALTLRGRLATGACKLRVYVTFLLIAAGSTACDQPNSMALNTLAIPERAETVYITDQIYVAGNSLSLWTQASDGGGCQLQVAQDKSQHNSSQQVLKPMSPCYFVKSPGSDKVQIFQQDKTTRIIAVLGTGVKDDAAQRCGSEVQGLIIDRNGKVRLSDHLLQDKVYCAAGGLDNFQYSLFHGS